MANQPLSVPGQYDLVLGVFDDIYEPSTGQTTLYDSEVDWSINGSATYFESESSNTLTLFSSPSQSGKWILARYLSPIFHFQGDVKWRVNSNTQSLQFSWGDNLNKFAIRLDYTLSESVLKVSLYYENSTQQYLLKQTSTQLPFVTNSTVPFILESDTTYQKRVKLIINSTTLLDFDIGNTSNVQQDIIFNQPVIILQGISGSTNTPQLILSDIELHNYNYFGDSVRIENSTITENVVANVVNANTYVNLPVASSTVTGITSLSDIYTSSSNNVALTCFGASNLWSNLKNRVENLPIATSNTFGVVNVNYLVTPPWERYVEVGGETIYEAGMYEIEFDKDRNRNWSLEYWDKTPISCLGAANLHSHAVGYTNRKIGLLREEVLGINTTFSNNVYTYIDNNTYFRPVADITGGTIPNLISYSGSVGINTINPTADFEVNGTLYASTYQNLPNATGSKRGIVFTTSTLTNSTSNVPVSSVVKTAIDNLTNTVDGITPSQWTGTSNIVFNPTNARVGIAKSAPNCELDVNGTICATTYSNLPVASASSRGNVFIAESLTTSTSNVPTASVVKTAIDTLQTSISSLQTSQGNIVSSQWIANTSNIYFTTNSNNGGSVGIGTSTPVEKLHVVGSVGINQGAYGVPFMRIMDRFGSTYFSMERTTGTTWGTSLEGRNAGPIIFQASNNGNVGIGTTSPSYKLHVSGQMQIQGQDTSNISTQGRLVFNNNKYGILNGAWSNASVSSLILHADQTLGSDIIFAHTSGGSVNTSDRTWKADMVIKGGTTSPQIGINTLSPEYTLDVNGSFRSSPSANFVSSIGQTPFTFLQQEAGASSNANVYSFDWGLTNSRTFYHTIKTDVIRFPKSVMLTSDHSELESSLLGHNDNGDLRVWLNSTYQWKNGAVPRKILFGTPTNTYMTMQGGSCTVHQPLIVQSAVTATTFTQSSDILLKENIEKIDTASIDAFFKTCSGYRYNFRTDKTKRIGLIAQEVQQILPEVVDVDSDSGYLKISYTDMVPVLVEAIKQLRNKYDELAKKIAC